MNAKTLLDILLSVANAGVDLSTLKLVQEFTGTNDTGDEFTALDDIVMVEITDSELILK